MTLTSGAPDGKAGHILADVFRSVLAHAGLKGEASDRLLDQVMNERRKSASEDCTVRFASHAGELEITLSQNGHDWRTSCPAPGR